MFSNCGYNYNYNYYSTKRLYNYTIFLIYQFKLIQFISMAVGTFVVHGNKSSAVAEMGDRVATIDMGRKLGVVPFFLGGQLGPNLTKNVVGAEAYLLVKFHLDPSNRLVTVHQRHRQDRTGQDRQYRQRSDSIGRTVLQTVAQKRFALCHRTVVVSV